VLYWLVSCARTFVNPPFLNEVHSDGVKTFHFRLGGDRGLDILASGSPALRGRIIGSSWPS
jgi:hypothetical protein